MQPSNAFTVRTGDTIPGAATQRPTALSFEEVRRRALAGVFTHASRVFVVGEDLRAADVTHSGRPAFVSAADIRIAPDDGTTPSEVLAISLEEPWITRAAELARQLGRRTLYVLLDNTPGDSSTSCSGLSRAGPRLRELGFAVLGFHRVFWPPQPDPSGALSSSRTARLDRETREVLVECRHRSDPETLAVLEQRVATLSRQLDLLSDLQVQQAKPREAESRRLGRLDELEATVARLERIRSLQARALLVEESKEINHLREEIAFMKATRFWRLGERYWALRRWLASRAG
jgi:hypothetical protein